MTLKEKLLDRLFKTENYYIRRYLHYLRMEEFYLFVNPIKLLSYCYKMRKNRLGAKLGFIIHAGNFGEGLKIYHYGSIIVNPKARIGKNCIIHGNCCIGSDGSFPDESPIVGNNVDIGNNAQILGGIKVADGVRIGAGAVVVRDILKPGVTVVGVPAGVVEK